MEAKHESRDHEEWKFFVSWIKNREEDDELTVTMPSPMIVKYPDLVEKAWGWDRLLPFVHTVLWSDYTNYLEEYYNRNAHELVPGAADDAAAANICLEKEKQLASEWKIRMKSCMDMILPSKAIILSCLIQERVRSAICAAGSGFSPALAAALMCIATEAGLICELLSRGADPSDDYLIIQSSEIRMCALSLMNCSSGHSVAAAAAMLGITREAKTLCQWMSINEMLLDPFDDLPDELTDGSKIRFRTLDVMIKILEMSSASVGHNIDKEECANGNGSGVDRDGIASSEAENTTGGDTSDVLNCQDLKKIKVTEKSKKSKRKRKRKGENKEANHRELGNCKNLTREFLVSVIEDTENDNEKTIPLPRIATNHDLVEKAWGWDRLLLPLSGPIIAFTFRSITIAMLVRSLLELLYSVWNSSCWEDFPC